jgi:hypothetical protein
MAEPNDQTDDQTVSRGDPAGDAPDLARAEEAAEREAAQMASSPEDDAASSEPAPESAKTATKVSRPTDSNAAPARSAHVGVRAVPGETLSVSRASLPSASAGSVEVRQGGIGRVEAQDVAVTLGGIGMARGDRVSVELGGMGAGIGRDVRLTQGAANLLVGREVHVDQSLVQTVAASNVRFERPSVVVFLLARRVEGPVRALFDWRGAIAFGAVAGLVASLLRRRNN